MTQNFVSIFHFEVQFPCPSSKSYLFSLHTWNKNVFNMSHTSKTIEHKIHPHDVMWNMRIQCILGVHG